MREDVIYDAVTDIDEDLIEAAQKKKRLPVKWIAAAAAVAARAAPSCPTPARCCP